MKHFLFAFGLFFLSVSSIFSQSVFSKIDRVQILQAAYDKAEADLYQLNEKMMKTNQGYGNRSPIVKKRNEILVIGRLLQIEEARKKKTADTRQK